MTKLSATMSYFSSSSVGTGKSKKLYRRTESDKGFRSIEVVEIQGYPASRIREHGSVEGSKQTCGPVGGHAAGKGGEGDKD